MDLNKKLLGKRIKELRKNAKLTQEDLAEIIGIETSSLSGIESGRHYPSLKTLNNISDCLHLPIKTFFSFSHFKSPTQMKEIIVNNIDKIDNSTLTCIYKLFEDFE